MFCCRQVDNNFFNRISLFKKTTIIKILSGALVINNNSRRKRLQLQMKRNFKASCTMSVSPRMLLSKSYKAERQTYSKTHKVS